MYNENLKVQYAIMTDERKIEGKYVPSFDELIAEAPNDEMAQKWADSKDLYESTKDKSFGFDGFAFNSVYMMKMSCGHYEIFQHHSRDEDDLMEWVELMQSEKYYKKCTRCICGA